MKNEETTLPGNMDFRELWSGMKEYYDMGLSMIWARLEREVVGGVDREPKTPLGAWKSAQKLCWSEEALSSMMMKAKVSIAPTIVCGKVSGNLEIIDIDVKYWPGIDAMYFAQVMAMFPILFDRLRIHRTGSGGYHILYRCEIPIGVGNKKLAAKVDNPKAGLETRGEGGYALCPPGAGYTVHQDRPIPVITRAEREALIKIATLFDERIKVHTPKKVKEHESIYDENPFQHYNSSSEAEQLLANDGWAEFENNNQFTHYTRPGKASGISASWIKDKRRYHIFTSSTQLEPESSYDPAELLTILQFGGDKSKAFKYLVDKGYGKVKKSYEAKVIKTLAQVKDKQPPANFSAEAKAELEIQRTQIELKYPHGTYWEYIEKRGYYLISNTEIIDVANGHGIARYNNHLVRIDDVFFHRITEPEAFTILLEYIKEDREDYIKIADAFMAKWKQYNGFLLERIELREIKKEETLRSTELIYYKPFRNGVLEITADKLFLETDVSRYDKFIDKDSIIDFPWREVTEEQYRNCKYVKYLTLAISTPWKFVQKAIGYLCYDHKRRGSGYLLMLLEGVRKGSGGGSGKGLFFEMLGDPRSEIKPGEMKKWTTVKSISGSQIEKGEAEMMQMWNGEAIVHFSDTPKNVNLSKMKNAATDGGPVKKLYTDVLGVSAEDYPAIGMSSQWGINIEEDPGLKRRVRVLTFTDFFNVNREIRDFFGGSFPDMWTEDDWAGYYNYIANGIKEFLGCGKKLEEIEDLDLMWEKNFDQNYGASKGELRLWIQDFVEEWERHGFIPSAKLLEAYEQFCTDNKIKVEMSIPRLHEAFKSWCDRMGYEYEPSVRKGTGSDRCRGSVIRKKNPDTNEDVNLD